MFVRKCKTCKKEFTIDQEQADWLKKKGLELFTHCECCRKECRAANEQQKKGITVKDPVANVKAGGGV